MKKTRSMTTFDIILVPFPFADLRSTKRRPCLVLRSFKIKGLGELMIIAMVTSNLGGIEFPGDLQLQDITAAGLPKPSMVRLSKVVTIEAKLIKKKLGSLGRSDRSFVVKEFKKFYEDILS